MSLKDIYQQTILEHARHPRNAGRLENPTHRGYGKNPLCGDALELMLQIEEGVIVALKFVGEGCAISQASCSLLTVELEGKTVAEATKLLEKMIDLLTEKDVADLPPRLQALSGVRMFPARVKCAMLAWRVLERCLEAREGEVSTEAIV